MGEAWCKTSGFAGGLVSGKELAAPHQRTKGKGSQSGGAILQEMPPAIVFGPPVDGFFYDVYPVLAHFILFQVPNHIIFLSPGHKFIQIEHDIGYHRQGGQPGRSEEHTSELQSLMRISYAVFCLKKKISNNNQPENMK